MNHATKKGTIHHKTILRRQNTKCAFYELQMRSRKILWEYIIVTVNVINADFHLSIFSYYITDQSSFVNTSMQEAIIFTCTVVMAQADMI